jgi:uncharacterized membrane protein
VTKTRLEAFSDGVIAIIITIMVLELKLPEAPTFAALHHVGGEILLYALSFVFVGIYWSNHHHLLHACNRVNGTILWANLHLLFWLSLVPFATRWMGEAQLQSVPTAAYGSVFLCCAIAWTFLQMSIIKADGASSKLAKAVGRDAKGKLSGLMYVAAVPLAFVNPIISDVIFVTVALIWLVPDRRIEAALGD